MEDMSREELITEVNRLSQEVTKTKEQYEGKGALRAWSYAIATIIIGYVIWHHIDYTNKVIAIYGAQWGPVEAQQDLYNTMLVVFVSLALLWLFTRHKKK